MVLTFVVLIEVGTYPVNERTDGCGDDRETSSGMEWGQDQAGRKMH